MLISLVISFFMYSVCFSNIDKEKEIRLLVRTHTADLDEKVEIKLFKY
jgi:hypothetical protein